MADFFSKLKKGLDKGTAIVSAKSNTLIESNKLKSEINAAKKFKKETLLEIGKVVYEDGKAGTFTIESVEELITRASESEVKVADLEAKIIKIQEEEKEKMADIKTAAAPVDVDFEEVVDDVTSEVDDIVGDVTDVAEDAVDDAKEVAEDLADDAQEAAEDTVDNISDVVSSALNEGKDLF